MFDHAFLQAIGALRRSVEGALLERHTFEERLQIDILLGDLSFETSYTLPGEGVPPRVQAEIAFDWPTWSQTAYRAWAMGEGLGDPPEIDVEIAVRVQRMASAPEPAAVLAVLPDAGPAALGEGAERSGPSVEQHSEPDSDVVHFALEVSYSGVLRLEEDVLEDNARLDALLAGIGGWVASTLVRLADLDIVFLPPEMEEGGRR
ncbi:MAG TPA: hypothetical protein VMZ51_00380 [Acidimicrobiales bacterium]|nr:hypothetical protein [Acidimicrobiales bacterium]